MSVMSSYLPHITKLLHNITALLNKREGSKCMTFINLHKQIKKLKREEKETNGDSGGSMNQDSTRISLGKI